ncbi:Vesicle transport protein SFT2A, putative [Perkinsus marinus ATCC 50983]|uniref:Vesicle transport protein n=1 Tax=Perkinsus marinus (strain ATCC 50983 / TXsc) TaxID=423536 RepID=C5LE97_PERM5|nr:Vesicle transport protein SFT2A, putative [Perkinsus marinus ATCC 50983]EER04965.1 Vesicle transport protein SFT2A, putative [Perkinsus marinus ATCC 50983]|eukprot:XP_002773149.1 Vesicle transport protein SFT2A, putative [Perkinsus marinus ATCC 50983]
MMVWCKPSMSDDIEFTALSNALPIRDQDRYIPWPLRQVKCMFRNNRVIAAGIYVLALFTTLYTCIHSPHHRALILLAVIIQFLALFWYALSYIPYGRQMTTSVTSHLTQRLLAD